MKRINVLAVCGFGVGSSMILKMKIDDIVKGHGLDAEVLTADVGTASATPCDVIFTSSELEASLKEKVHVPIVAIHNFVNKKEIEEKGLSILKMLCGVI
jgi:PTS system ascorbate-specific IIB component